MLQQIFAHARERLTFGGETPPAKRLAACKAFLKQENERLLKAHRAGEAGIRIAIARATQIDLVVEHLFAAALASWRRREDEPPTQVALLALGGYGRGELCPMSDVDLMFLFPSKARPEVLKPFQEHLTQEILYLLWDLALKVGHSTRTIEEVFVEARKDVQTKTALLEARRLAGSEQLYETFRSAYRNFYLKEDPKGYIAARLADQQNRRAKLGDTVFLQEPNIKSGVGGLRDYQNTLWMARVKLGIDRMEELAALNYLRPEELREFQAAYDFLLRVRHELHFITRHATDLLNLENQPKVAQGLGYPQRNPLERVEAFMQDYYRHARCLFQISKLVEDRLALSLQQPENGKISFKEVIRARRHERLKRVDGFIVRGKQLAAEKLDVFEEDPRRLVRVFRHLQQMQCTPDLDLVALIRESLPLLDRRAVHSPEANLSFKAILQDAGRVHPTLALMHDLGVLGRFLPEFEQLNCLVQHEFYHRYTADIHTLNAIRELDRIYSGEDPATRLYRDELHECQEPTLLYLILLLHDIGKGAGIEGHDAAGVRIAEPILERLEIDQRNREIVTFVIKNHLAMARFWQKRDVDDPETIAAFAELVGDVEKLRFLFVHTLCDARGTSAELWNSYKNTLHTTLFLHTRERLIHGEALDQRLAERKAMLQRDLIARKIADLSPEEIDAHFNLLPERYFVQTDPDEVLLHIRMVHRLLATIANAESVGTLKPEIDWADDVHRSYTVVNVVTWDRAGLFYRLAGALSVAGLNILSAKVVSRADHIAIDTFHVVEPGRGLVQNKAAMETFARTVESTLVANKDLLPEILAQANRVRTSRLATEERSLHASFPPVVDVYHELGLKRTIVEVQASDQIGLLYRLARAIYEHGFDITFARINTERGIAIDTFYIQSANQVPTEDTARLHELRDAIAAIIAPAPETAAAV
jgi:[protein-PII] uridylyltransferase